jgi:SRSO17 transposase
MPFSIRCGILEESQHFQKQRIRKGSYMKSSHDITAKEARPSLQEIAAWSLSLSRWHERLTSYFARPEPRQHALLYLRAILSEIPRKNGWQIAEHARQPHPYGMQRLLSRAVWDQEGVRDELRSLVCQALSPPPVELAPAEPEAIFPVLVLDESGFPKRGTQSAGVQKQYCGVSGRVENCQVGVFLSYVTALGHALIDRELYLPEDWCHDLPRRQAAHIPESVTFRTKPELAKLMVERAQAAGLPIRWVVADTVYGHCPDLRDFLEAQGYPYALSVPCTEVVCVQTQAGWLLRDVASIGQEGLGAQDWQRLSQSAGTKGERLFDWAMLPLVQHGTVDHRHWLVFRRCLDDPTEVTSYLVWTPQADTPLPLIVQAIGARWHIEEDLQTGKDLGLDQYEVRSYVGWYRHVTLVLLASGFLVGICVQEQQAHPPPQEPIPPSPLIALTTCEVRHLLARLIWPAPCSALLICHWSQWRRAHQYWAGYYHRRRRLKTSSA